MLAMPPHASHHPQPPAAPPPAAACVGVTRVRHPHASSAPPDGHQVDAVIARLVTGKAEAGAHVGIQLQLLPEGEVEGPEPLADGGCHRTLQADAMLLHSERGGPGSAGRGALGARGEAGVGRWAGQGKGMGAGA